MSHSAASMLADFSLGSNEWIAPRIFSLSSDKDIKEIEALLSAGKIHRTHDRVDLAIAELFDIDHPEMKDTKSPGDIAEFSQSLTKGKPSAYGSWVFFPWSGNLVHFPPVNDLRRLRTARNRNLVTASEQDKLYGSTILVGGLSVGSNVVDMLISQGIGGKLILVDMDIIEPTNLNRIKTVYSEVGTHKVHMVAKRISEIDPYIDQVHLLDGLNEQNLQQVINGHRPDVLVDEIDNLDMKIQIRAVAKKEKIPVVMATDNGDNAILDIERYDIDDTQVAFDGRIPQEIIEKIQQGTLSRPETGMLIGKYFVGADNIPLRMFQSLIEVGRTIPSWPQLASAATMSGLVCAYAIKKIILEQPLVSGRHLFDIDAQMNPEVSSADYKQKTDEFINRFFV